MYLEFFAERFQLKISHKDMVKCELGLQSYLKTQLRKDLLSCSHTWQVSSPSGCSPGLQLLILGPLYNLRYMISQGQDSWLPRGVIQDNEGKWEDPRLKPGSFYNLTLCSGYSLLLWDTTQAQLNGKKGDLSSVQFQMGRYSPYGGTGMAGGRS